jgi:hypothetical protein
MHWSIGFWETACSLFMRRPVMSVPHCSRDVSGIREPGTLKEISAVERQYCSVPVISR